MARFALSTLLGVALFIAGCGSVGDRPDLSSLSGLTGVADLPRADETRKAPDITAVRGSSVTVGLAGQTLAPAPAVGGSRPATVHVPPSYVPSHPVPLVILLHGYGASGAIEEAYMNLTPLSDERGFLYAYPDGTPDLDGNRFWNATDACCNFFDARVDDSVYLTEVILDIEARYSILPRQVFIIGHSNGAFMAYRMACDHADLVSGIVSLAGAMWEDAASCQPSQPVSILEIHGTDDPLVPFDGGSLLGRAFPSTATTVSDWLAFDGCSDGGTSLPNLDLDSKLSGAETTVTRYGECKPRISAELWTIVGGGHIPALSDSFAPDVIDHLLPQTKP